MSNNQKWEVQLHSFENGSVKTQSSTIGISDLNQNISAYFAELDRKQQEEQEKEEQIKRNQKAYEEYATKNLAKRPTIEQEQKMTRISNQRIKDELFVVFMKFIQIVICFGLFLFLENQFQILKIGLSQLSAYKANMSVLSAICISILLTVRFLIHKEDAEKTVQEKTPTYPLFIGIALIIIMWVAILLS